MEEIIAREKFEENFEYLNNLEENIKRAVEKDEKYRETILFNLKLKFLNISKLQGEVNLLMGGTMLRIAQIITKDMKPTIVTITKVLNELIQVELKESVDPPSILVYNKNTVEKYVRGFQKYCKIKKDLGSVANLTLLPENVKLESLLPTSYTVLGYVPLELDANSDVLPRIWWRAIQLAGFKRPNLFHCQQATNEYYGRSSQTNLVHKNELKKGKRKNNSEEDKDDDYSSRSKKKSKRAPAPEPEPKPSPPSEEEKEEEEKEVVEQLQSLSSQPPPPPSQPTSQILPETELQKQLRQHTQTNISESDLMFAKEMQQELGRLQLENEQLKQQQEKQQREQEIVKGVQQDIAEFNKAADMKTAEIIKNLQLENERLKGQQQQQVQMDVSSLSIEQQTIQKLQKELERLKEEQENKESKIEGLEYENESMKKELQLQKARSLQKSQQKPTVPTTVETLNQSTMKCFKCKEKFIEPVFNIPRVVQFRYVCPHCSAVQNDSHYRILEEDDLCSAFKSIVLKFRGRIEVLLVGSANKHLERNVLSLLYLYTEKAVRDMVKNQPFAPIDVFKQLEEPDCLDYIVWPFQLNVSGSSSHWVLAIFGKDSPIVYIVDTMCTNESKPENFKRVFQPIQEELKKNKLREWKEFVRIKWTGKQLQKDTWSCGWRLCCVLTDLVSSNFDFDSLKQNPPEIEDVKTFMFEYFGAVVTGLVKKKPDPVIVVLSSSQEPAKPDGEVFFKYPFFPFKENNKSMRELHKNQLEQLNDEQWLGDEIICCWLSFLEWQWNTINPNRVFVVHSWFIDLAPNKGPSYLSTIIKTRCGEKLKASDFKFIIVPVNINKSHWCLLVVDIQAKQIAYYDSLGTYSNEETICNLVKENLEKCDLSEFDGGKARAPKQSNLSDCGVFILKYADLIVSGQQQLEFDPVEDIKKYRKEIRESFEMFKKTQMFRDILIQLKK